MNKTIHMTYYKNIPDFVFNRWKELNPNYNIEFSLDSDCIYFLRRYFNDNVVNKFINIKTISEKKLVFIYFKRRNTRKYC